MKKYGGQVEDFIELHRFFDYPSKAMHPDFRHRALRHHTQGIFELEVRFGPTITLSSGRIIPTRWVGEDHVREDLGVIPTLSDWLSCIKPAPWMARSRRLSEELEGPEPESEDESAHERRAAG